MTSTLRESPANARTPQFAPIEELIKDVAAGKMVIQLDDLSGQPRAHLTIPARFAGEQAVNFMATHGRGLVCLGLSAERIKALGLKPLPRRNKHPGTPEFYQSIEAKDGVSTGISASDRAQTILAAYHPDSPADAVVTPGHVFPLCAHSGGILARQERSEAAIELCQLADLEPAATICDILNEVGDLAGPDDLQIIAARHGLKIGRYSDLLTFCKARHGFQIEARHSLQDAALGPCTVLDIREEPKGARHLVLTCGDITAPEPLACHVRHFDPANDLFGLAIGARPNDMRHLSFDRIAHEQRGAFVVLHTESLTGPEKDNDENDEETAARLLASLGVRHIAFTSPSRSEPLGDHATMSWATK
ncbi:3,4-dihydroxy-2-butanone-4-phosphate synthase [Celeribacter sp.]|uniref:3,4-dihydroxy-2-butanone-4-phosphate synthase n=1 Tax=Celeribacter sp. TaxID=1890673 RepID=UPI003A8F5E4B